MGGGDRSGRRFGGGDRSAQRFGGGDRSGQRFGGGDRSSDRFGGASKHNAQGGMRNVLRGVEDDEGLGEEVPYSLEGAEGEETTADAAEHLEAKVPFSTVKDIISPQTYKAITDTPMRIETMSAVQAQIMALFPNLATPHPKIEPNPELQAGRKDIVIQAKTGTGKTLAFLIPAIEQRVRTLAHIGKQAAIDAGKPEDPLIAERAARAYARLNVGTLIISPTRELATQIANEAIRVTTHHPEFEVRLFVGGVSKGTQMREFMRGRRDIVVATTGRLLDLLRSEPDLKESLKETQMVRSHSHINNLAG